MTSARNHQIAPGLRQYLPLPYGWVRQAQRDPLNFFLEGRQRFGDVFRYQVGPYVFFLLSHPDHIKHVLQDHARNYPRSWFYNFVKLVLGEGLVTSEGAFWRRQRRLAQPAFHRQRIAALAGIMAEMTAAMLARWRGHAGTGQPLDVAAEMMRLTLGIAGQTLFSTDVSGEAAVVGQALPVAMAYINFRINHPIAWPVSVPTPRNLRFKKAMGALDRVVYGIIAQRRKEAKDRGDLLSMLLLARDEETGEGMSDQQLRDEVITFLLAGHETTGVALSWIWYLLSQHPAVERRLRGEVATVLNGRTPTVHDLPHLTYTRMVIEEAMRLYPPVWGIDREVLADDEVGGYHIPAKSVVVLSQFVTHRHPAFWDNPEGFDPERFTPERVAQRPRYAYFPFAGGPHQCIGNEFALMEAQLVVAMVTQTYRLQLMPGYRVEPDPIFTLRPRPGVVMTVERVGS
jgi:cytochrome P450